MRIISLTGFFVIAFGIMVQSSFAHTPFCSCFDNGDGTITCEGGFSDGSSAEGATMIVKDKDEKILVKGRMNEDGEFTFKKPEKKYTVKMDGGDMHIVNIAGEEIFE